MADATKATQGLESTNIQWHYGELGEAERANFLGQSGGILWFTGLSGAGKSTVSRRVERLLVQRGKFVAVLDGDNLRHGLCADLGFSDADRRENIRRVGETAVIMAHANILVLTALISPFKEDRDRVRNRSGGRFAEVYCAADLDLCASRDPKGLYAKAQKGEIPSFTGISSPYEAPQNAEVVLETGKYSIDESAEQVIQYLEAEGWI